MKDFNSTLFTQLKTSDKFHALIQEFNQLKDNIEKNSDMNQLFEMLEHNRISWPLRETVEKIIDGYVKGLLEGLDLSSLSLYPSYSSYSIHYAFDKIPSFEYQPNYWASPASELVCIDFKKQQIIVYESEDDYKKADELFQKNIEKEREKLQELKNHLALMKRKRKSRAFILKEIRDSIWSLNVPKYLLFHISCYLLPARYKVLLDAADEMIQNQEKKVQNQKKRVQEYESKSYMNIHKELRNMQQQVLQKLEPLCFKTVTETVESVFSKENND